MFVLSLHFLNVESEFKTNVLGLWLRFNINLQCWRPRGQVLVLEDPRRGSWRTILKSLLLALALRVESLALIETCVLDSITVNLPMVVEWKAESVQFTSTNN